MTFETVGSLKAIADDKAYLVRPPHSGYGGYRGRKSQTLTKGDRMIEVYAFNNGNVAVFQNGEQVPQCQDPWIMSITGNLNREGFDPTDAVIHLPDGFKAKFFRTTEGHLNWRVIP